VPRGTKDAKNVTITPAPTFAGTATTHISQLVSNKIFNKKITKEGTVKSLSIMSKKEELLVNSAEMSANNMEELEPWMPIPTIQTFFSSVKLKETSSSSIYS
jgi:hypothetical protein